MERNLIADEETEFLRLVHRLMMEKGQADDHREKRQKDRSPYPMLQQIAPFVAGQRPDELKFVERRCIDISTGGFSFLVPAPLTEREIVVALGTEPRVTYVRASVARQTPVTQVGCRFIGRVSG